MRFLNKILFLPVFALLCYANAVLAQNYPPNAPQKCIFYWNSLQADLLLTNNYKAEIRTTYNNFRQTIFQQPKLWNGKKLVRNFSFEVNGFEVRVDSVPINYNGHVAAIELKVGKSIKTGDTIRVRQIALDEGVLGSIDIVLESATPPATPTFEGPLPYFSFSPTLLSAVRWGNAVNTDVSMGFKEYYLPNEVEDLLRTPPILTFMPDSVAPPTMELLMKIRQENQERIAFSVSLDPNRFAADLAGLLRPYAFLIAPGTEIQYEVRKDKYSSAELRFAMQITDENDPRRQLRPTNMKHLEMVWGDYSGNYSFYLQSFKAANGETLYADRPGTMRLQQKTYSHALDPDGTAAFEARKRLERMLQSRPILRVNGKELAQFSFTLQLNGKNYEVGASELVPAEVGQSLHALLEESKGTRRIQTVSIRNIQNAPGFDFGQLAFNLYFSSGD